MEWDTHGICAQAIYCPQHIQSCQGAAWPDREEEREVRWAESRLLAAMLSFSWMEGGHFYDRAARIDLGGRGYKELQELQ